MKRSKSFMRVTSVLLSFILILMTVNMPVSSLRVFAKEGQDEEIHSANYDELEKQTGVKEDNSSEEQSEVGEKGIPNEQLETNEDDYLGEQSEIDDWNSPVELDECDNQGDSEGQIDSERIENSEELYVQDDTDDLNKSSETEEQSNIDGTVEENVLDEVQNIRWIPSATVSWDEVKGADYYAVKVTVFDKDGVTVLGDAETGTSENQLDVQQEIYRVIGDNEYNVVKVTASIVAQKMLNGEIFASSDSAVSDFWSYRMVPWEKIPTPTKVRLTDECMVEFEYDLEQSKETQVVHGVSVTFYYDGYGYLTHQFYSYSPFMTEVDWENGNGRIDAKDAIEHGYQYYKIEGEVNVCCSIILLGNSGYINSDESDFSNSMIYIGGELIVPVQISAPTNVRITEDYAVEFDYDLGDSKETDAVSNVYVSFYYEGYGSKQYIFESNTHFFADVEWNNGKARIDVSDEIEDGYHACLAEGEVNVSCTVLLCARNKYNSKRRYIDSIVSEYSNPIKYKGKERVIVEPVQLSAPYNVKLTEDYIVEFDYDILDPKKAISDVLVDIYFEGYGFRTSSYLSQSAVNFVEWDNGKARINVKSAILDGYRWYKVEGDVNVKCNVGFRGREGYVNSSQSEESNSIIFDGFYKIKSLTIAPSFPIVCIEHSYYIGKTITPTDAHYNSIEWTSDDENIVTIDKNGRITGIKEGVANITATIDQVSATVPVTVFSIDSNIENSDDSENVIDAAGELIDCLANDDNPDISKTDINQKDIAKIKNDIHDAIENDNTFHTDIDYIQQSFDLYEKNWGQVQKTVNNLNAQFEGAYNIEVEMYHKDQEGNQTHIGNITEFENEVTFTFDLPTGIKEEKYKGTKKYVLVRIHENAKGKEEYTPINYTINDDGTFTACSECFSDFVWVSIDQTNLYASLSEISNSSSGVLLKWKTQKDKRVAQYSILRKEGNGEYISIAKVSGTTYTDKKVDLGKKYTYTVCCLDDKGRIVGDYDRTGKSIKSSSGQLAINLSNKSSGVTISWGKVSGAAKYSIFRKKEGGSWKKIATTSSLSYTDKKAIYSKKYIYSVRALNSKGAYLNNYGSGNAIQYFVTGPNITLKNIEPGIEISWKPMSNAVKYQVYAKKASGKWKRIATVNGTSYIDCGVDQKKSYTYSVVGFDSSGHAMNDNGKESTITRKYTVISMEGISTLNGLELSWNAFNGAAKYEIYRLRPSGTWKKLATVTDLHYLDAEASANEKNTYSVLAVAPRTTAATKERVLTNYSTKNTFLFFVPPTKVSTSLKSSGIKLEWEEIINSSKYRVYRKTKTTDWSLIGTTSGLNYTDKTAQSGKTYYYSVVAVDAKGKAINEYGSGTKIKYTK